MSGVIVLYGFSLYTALAFRIFVCVKSTLFSPVRIKSSRVCIRARPSKSGFGRSGEERPRYTPLGRAARSNLHHHLLYLYFGPAVPRDTGPRTLSDSCVSKVIAWAETHELPARSMAVSG